MNDRDMFGMKIEEFIDTFINLHIEQEQWASISLNDVIDEDEEQEMLAKLTFLTERLIELEYELKANAMSDDDIWELKEDAMEIYNEQTAKF